MPIRDAMLRHDGLDCEKRPCQLAYMSLCDSAVHLSAWLLTLALQNSRPWSLSPLCLFFNAECQTATHHSIALRFRPRSRNPYLGLYLGIERRDLSIPAMADHSDMISIAVLSELQIGHDLQYAAMITVSCVIVAMS
jgi:hypothetical protein